MLIRVLQLCPTWAIPVLVTLWTWSRPATELYTTWLRDYGLIALWAILQVVLRGSKDGSEDDQTTSFGAFCLGVGIGTVISLISTGYEPLKQPVRAIPVGLWVAVIAWFLLAYLLNRKEGTQPAWNPTQSSKAA